MHINYTMHNRCGVAVIKSPKIFGNRLGHLSMENDSSWALRDYVYGVMLRSGDSERTLTQIESIVEDYEKPEYRAVGRKREWASELASLSKKRFGKQYDALTPPDDSWGRWRPLR